MHHIFFIHSSVDGHLACFHVLTIVNSAVTKIGVHVSFWIISPNFEQLQIWRLRMLHVAQGNSWCRGGREAGHHGGVRLGGPSRERSNQVSPVQRCSLEQHLAQGSSHFPLGGIGGQWQSPSKELPLSVSVCHTAPHPRIIVWWPSARECSDKITSQLHDWPAMWWLTSTC